MRNFNIQFSGKDFPEGRPSSFTISTQDEATAKAWGQKQLGAWRVDPATIRCVVTEMFVPVEPAQKQKPSKKG